MVKKGEIMFLDKEAEGATNIMGGASKLFSLFMSPFKSMSKRKRTHRRKKRGKTRKHKHCKG